jgi:hypothetical protein
MQDSTIRFPCGTCGATGGAPFEGLAEPSVALRVDPLEPRRWPLETQSTERRFYGRESALRYTIQSATRETSASDSAET